MLTLLAGTSFAADEALSRADFLEEVVAVLRVAAPERSYTATGPLEIEVTEDGEEAGYIYLNNLYSSVSADPAKRLAEVQRFVAAILQPSQQTLSDADLERIFPVIRDTLNSITTRLHWTNESYHWHTNDADEVFVVLDGEVDMHYRERGEERVNRMRAGDIFFASNGTEHVAEPLGEARVLVIEQEGSE